MTKPIYVFEKTNVDFYDPSVAFVDDGNFVVEWGYENLKAPWNRHNFIQRFDSHGRPDGSAIELPSFLLDLIIAADADGNVAVAFREYAGAYDAITNVIVRRLNHNLEPKGPPITVFSSSSSSDVTDVDRPSIAFADDGSFVVEWEYETHFGDWHNFIQRFDSHGRPDGSAIELPSSWRHPTVAADADGNVAVVFREYAGADDAITNVVVQRLDHNLKPKGAPTTVFSSSSVTDIDDVDDPSIAFADEGSFVVEWEYETHFGDWHNFIQYFDSRGRPDGSAIELPSSWRHPTVAADADGNVAVAFRE